MIELAVAESAHTAWHESGCDGSIEDQLQLEQRPAKGDRRRVRDSSRRAQPSRDEVREWRYATNDHCPSSRIAKLAVAPASVPTTSPSRPWLSQK